MLDVVVNLSRTNEREKRFSSLNFQLSIQNIYKRNVNTSWLTRTISIVRIALKAPIRSHLCSQPFLPEKSFFLKNPSILFKKKTPPHFH